jgi:2-hydroxy-6-oxonona-2,4-dienedioate hydrolase
MEANPPMEDRIQQEGEHRFLEEGEGPVLLLLHGLFGALSNFGSVLGHFSKQYKVVIPMLPIYSLPILETNVKNLARYLKKFIEHKGYQEVHLLGNSLGGHAALIYSLENPEKVKTMTLTGSSGLYENAMGGSFPRREDKEYIRKKVAVTFYDPKHATDELVDECYQVVNDKGKLIRILSLSKSAIRHNMAKELPKIDIPTCLIWGKNDTVTPPDVAEEFQERLPRADLYWIDECGHAPMMEQPEAFNRILDEWLQERA